MKKSLKILDNVKHVYTMSSSKKQQHARVTSFLKNTIFNGRFNLVYFHSATLDSQNYLSKK
jgi:hypothetical protein